MLATPCAEQNLCAAGNVLVSVAVNRTGAGAALIAEPRLVLKYRSLAEVGVSSAEGLSVRVQVLAERVQPAEG